MTLSLSGKLAHEFDECLLPYKVDIVDRLSVRPEFGHIVDASKVPFWP